jgi:hypothetical protein
MQLSWYLLHDLLRVFRVGDRPERQPKPQTIEARLGHIRQRSHFAQYFLKTVEKVVTFLSIQIS